MVHLLSEIVVVVSALLLIGVALLVLGRPVVAERFIRGFASSVRTHFAEQIFRVVFGGSLVIYSSAMWQAGAFRLIGWLLVISSTVLMILPWQWHRRFGQRIMPRLIQYLWLYAIGSFAFGTIILYAVITPKLHDAL